MTGGETVTYRNLYENQQSTVLQSTFMISCNNFPIVPDSNVMDFGLWRRIEVFTWPSYFCNVPKNENEFFLDDNINEKLNNFKQLFMFLLLNVYYKDKSMQSIEAP